MPCGPCRAFRRHRTGCACRAKLLVSRLRAHVPAHGTVETLPTAAASSPSDSSLRGAARTSQAFCRWCSKLRIDSNPQRRSSMDSPRPAGAADNGCRKAHAAHKQTQGRAGTPCPRGEQHAARAKSAFGGALFETSATLNDALELESHPLAFTRRRKTQERCRPSRHARQASGMGPDPSLSTESRRSRRVSPQRKPPADEMKTNNTRSACRRDR